MSVSLVDAQQVLGSHGRLLDGPAARERAPIFSTEWIYFRVEVGPHSNPQISAEVGVMSRPTIPTGTVQLLILANP